MSHYIMKKIKKSIERGAEVKYQDFYAYEVGMEEVLRGRSLFEGGPNINFLKEVEVFWACKGDVVERIYFLIKDIWGEDFMHGHYVFGEVMEIFLKNNSLGEYLSCTRDVYIRKVGEG